MTRLPPKILGDIFEAYVSPTTGPSILATEKKNISPDILVLKATFCKPETLRLVCREWKRVADERTVLWSKVLVKAEQTTWDETPRVQPPYCYGLEKRVDRLIDVPWSLTIVAPRRSIMTKIESETVAYTGKVTGIRLTTLLHRPAYESVDRVLINLHANTLSELGHTSFPNATSAVLYSPSGARRTWDFDAPEESLPEYLPNLPKVTKLILDGDLLFWDTIPKCIPWSQITHLFMGKDIPFAQWKAIFKLCTALERGCFKLSICAPNLDPKWAYQYPQPAHATLPHLKELAFLKASMFLLSDVSDISMPSLEKLQIVHRFKSPTLWDFGHKDFGGLTHLTLMSDTSVSGKDLVPILKMVPLLRELMFRVGKDFEEIFGFLTVKEGCRTDNLDEGSNALVFLERVGVSIRPVPYEALDYDESDAFVSDDEDRKGGPSGGGGGRFDMGRYDSDSEDDDDDEDGGSSESSGDHAQEVKEQRPINTLHNYFSTKVTISDPAPAQAKHESSSNTRPAEEPERQIDSEDEVELPRSGIRWTPDRVPQWGDIDYEPYTWEVEDNYLPDPGRSDDPEYRRMWEQMGWRPDSPIFNYDVIGRFVESRNQERMVEGVARLKYMIVRIEKGEDADAHGIANDLAEVLRPFAKWGLQMMVHTVDGPVGDFDMGAGCEIKEYKHWDDGFMDFLDCEEMLSLCPYKDELK